MTNARIAHLAAAAICLLPFATPAIAELGHPSGCASCEPVELAAPTASAGQEPAPLFGPLLSTGPSAAATALAPETGVTGRPLRHRCHAQVWSATYPREYHVVCR